MKRNLLALVFFGLVILGRAEEPAFSQALSPAEFKAAGLDQLSPEQRQQLDELVRNFKQGQLAAAEKSAEGAVAAKRAAETEAQAAKEEARVAKEEAQAAKAQALEGKGSDRGFLAKAKVLLVPGTQIEYAEIRSTIQGKFEGWSGRTIFHLANGQRWQVANSNERYFTPPEDNVEVAVRPAALGGYWMYFLRLNTRVRVKLLPDK